MPRIISSIFDTVFLRMTLIVLLSASPFFAYPIQTNACSCAEISFAEETELASVVFVGEAISADPSEITTSGSVTYTFDVELFWKGNVGETIDIYTPDAGFCGRYDFALGYSYLVVAHSVRSDVPSVHACSFNTVHVTWPTDAEWLTDLLGEGQSPKSATPLPTATPIPPTTTPTPTVTPIPSTPTPTVTPIPPTATATPTATSTPAPEASGNEAIWGCRQSPGSADLPIVGLMVGIAWFGLRKRRPNGR